MKTLSIPLPDIGLHVEFGVDELLSAVPWYSRHYVASAFIPDMTVAALELR